MILKDFELTAIDPSEISLGRPVPWHIYDEFGKLLFKKGAVITSERQMKILIRVGLYAKEIQEEEVDTTPQPVKFLKRVNPFAEFDDICDRVANLFSLINRKEIPPEDQFEKRVFKIITTVQGLREYYTDAMHGVIHLPSDRPYCVYHALDMVILTDMVLDRLEVDQKKRLSVLAAALTSNIAMNPYQGKLHNQIQSLKPQQLAIIHKHPDQAVAILRMLGVNDNLWLKTVAQHHELLDGSGYPRGLTADLISQEARILTMADVYSAMISPRPYRKAYRHKEALRELFLNRGKLYDDSLTMVFLNELGIFPPGILVRLANKEIGVVIGKTVNPKAPLVASVKMPDGNAYLSPRRRNTAMPEFAIVATSSMNTKNRINPSTIWGINALRMDAPENEPEEDSIADLY